MPCSLMLCLQIKLETNENEVATVARSIFFVIGAVKVYKITNAENLIRDCRRKKDTIF